MVNECSNACFQDNNKKIIEKEICIDKCKNDDTYRYEYNNVCVQNCPQNFFILDFVCMKNCPLGYYSNTKCIKCLKIPI